MTIQDIIINLALCDETGDVPDYVDLISALHSIKADIKQLKGEKEDLKTALQKTLDAARFKPHIKEILAFHRQEFPFEPGDGSSEHRERYYWLSGFLHAYAEKWADIDDFGAPPDRLEKLEKDIEELGRRIYRVPYSK